MDKLIFTIDRQDICEHAAGGLGDKFEELEDYLANTYETELFYASMVDEEIQDFWCFEDDHRIDVINEPTWFTQAMHDLIHKQHRSGDFEFVTAASEWDGDYDAKNNR